MHGCIIWRFKPRIAIPLFPVEFRGFGIEARRLIPQSPFSGKAPPCGPRPLRLICNFRWTPSLEDRVTDTPCHPKQDHVSSSPKRHEPHVPAHTHIIPSRTATLPQASTLRSAEGRPHLLCAILVPSLWRNHYVAATKRGFAAGTEGHKIHISVESSRCQKHPSPRPPPLRRPKLIRPGSLDGPGRRLGTPPQ